MESKRIFKYLFYLFTTLFVINLIFSISLNNSLSNHFKNGLLDNVNVKTNTDYTLDYYYNGVKMDSFDYYADAMREQRHGILLYANNGLVYNRKTPLGNQSYVIDYSWLKKGIYDKEDIISYIDNNKLIMLFRIMYLSNGWLYILSVSLILMFIMKITVPSLLFFTVNIMTYFKYKSIPDKEKSDEQFKNFEIFRSLILTKSLNEFKKSRDYMFITIIYSYLVIYLMLINSSIDFLPNFIFPIILVYLGILTVVSLYTTIKVLYDIEFKKLSK